MNRNEEQKEREKYVFGEFAEVCPLEIISFENKNPPEPDILCQLNDGSELAFELVETVDNQKPHKDKVAEKAEKIWEDHNNNNLSNDEKERFEHVFSGCTLTLNLSDQATEKDIEKAIPLLFEKYKSICRNQLGLIRYEKRALPKGCDSIRIEPQKREPKFRCSRALYIQPEFVLERIKDKFDKSYEISCPIHLLIYSNKHPLGPDDIWDQPGTKSYIEDNIKSSPFEKIWIFDKHEGKIVYVYPRG